MGNLGLMDNLLGGILMTIIPIGVSAIFIYLITWFIYKHIVQPDIKKHMADEERRHEEIKAILTEIKNNK